MQIVIVKTSEKISESIEITICSPKDTICDAYKLFYDLTTNNKDTSISFYIKDSNITNHYNWWLSKIKNA